MSEERPFPPSKKKLKRLFRKGKVFRSSALSQPLIFLSFLTLLKIFPPLTLSNLFEVDNHLFNFHRVCKFLMIAFLFLLLFGFLQGRWIWHKRSHEDEGGSIFLQKALKMGFSILKLTILITVWFYFCKKMNFSDLKLYSSPKFLLNWFYQLSLSFGLAWLVIGTMEWGVSKFLYHRSLFMSEQEMKDESKEE